MMVLIIKYLINKLFNVNVSKIKLVEFNIFMILFWESSLFSLGLGVCVI